MNSRTQNGVSYVQGFDKENRLISVTTNGQTTQFKYDAAGQRTMTLAPNGLYTFYPFPNVEEEVNLNNGDYTLKYTYNTAGAAVGVRTKAKQGATTTNTLHYLYADHLGSTSVVTNASGGQVQQTRFLPFGGYWGTPTQTVTDRGYTGHLHNDEVGLIYMNARFYVPAVGRFASADTIVPNPTNPQAFNRYSYVKNNPLNRVDPTGHVDCGLLGGGEDSAGCEEAKAKPKHDNTNLFEGYTLETIDGITYIVVDYGSGPFEFYATEAGLTAGKVYIPINSINLDWKGTPQTTYAGLEDWEMNARNIFSEMYGIITNRLPYAIADAIAFAYSPYNRMNSSDLSWSGGTIQSQLLRGSGDDDGPVQYAIGFKDEETGEWVISGAMPQKFTRVETFHVTLIIAYGVDQGYLWDTSFGSQNYAHNPVFDGPYGPGYFRNPNAEGTTFELLQRNGLIP